MQDNWTEKLSDYIDGEMPAPERERCEVHLESCADCRAVLQELREVVLRAGTMAEVQPVTDLWPGIEARLGSAGLRPDVRPLLRTPRRRIEFSLPQLAAAAVALMVVSAGATVAFGNGATGVPVVVNQGIESGNAIAAAAGADQYEMAITEMEQALDQGREHLDPETVRILRENLGAIDAAILEARGALAGDPGSAYLNSYLARTMRRKLKILERGNNLIAAASL